MVLTNKLTEVYSQQVIYFFSKGEKKSWYYQNVGKEHMAVAFYISSVIH